MKIKGARELASWLKEHRKGDHGVIAVGEPGFFGSCHRIRGIYVSDDFELEVPEKRKYIKFGNRDNGENYLNVEKYDLKNGKFMIHNRDKSLYFKTAFDTNEIEILKQREDLAIDWSKVTFEAAD